MADGFPPIKALESKENRALFVRRFSFSGPLRSSFFLFGSSPLIVFPFRILFVRRFSFSGPLHSSFFLFGSSSFVVFPFRVLFVRRFSFSGPLRSSFFLFGSSSFVVFPFRVLFVHGFSFSRPLRSSFFLFGSSSSIRLATRVFLHESQRKSPAAHCKISAHSSRVLAVNMSQYRDVPSWDFGDNGIMCCRLLPVCSFLFLCN